MICAAAGEKASATAASATSVCRDEAGMVLNSAGRAGCGAGHAERALERRTALQSSRRGTRDDSG